ncbi:hypothetical protein HD806DRAFT_482515 [Xylariaceae sp. AK1471]|nr:hypothetical protein HD806DRAFT_482515 [Xylariaceae sp. AK1471]
MPAPFFLSPTLLLILYYLHTAISGKRTPGFLKVTCIVRTSIYLSNPIIPRRLSLIVDVHDSTVRYQELRLRWSTLSPYTTSRD